MTVDEVFEMFWLWDQYGVPVAGQPGRLGALTGKWRALTGAQKLALLESVEDARAQKEVSGAR